MKNTARPDHCRRLACLDCSGATVSTLCALHCALTPVLISLLPAIGLSILADERVETGLMVLSGALGLASLGLGYAQHRSPWVVVVLVVGFVLLGVGRLAEGSSVEAIGGLLVVGGGLAVATAHLLSHHLGKLSRPGFQPRTSS